VKIREFPECYLRVLIVTRISGPVPYTFLLVVPEICSAKYLYSII